MRCSTTTQRASTVSAPEHRACELLRTLTPAYGKYRDRSARPTCSFLSGVTPLSTRNTTTSAFTTWVVSRFEVERRNIRLVPPP